jgi:Hypothetical protein (DUF2513)
MQRNMDLVRMILLRMEADPSGRAPNDLGIRSYERDQVGYHAHIMAQEGLIEAIEVTGFESTGPEVIPTGLTWKGHEFLDLARDQERWNKAKAIIAKVGTAPISVWMKVLGDLLWKTVETVSSKANP